jgi:hypothetical protein
MGDSTSSGTGLEIAKMHNISYNSTNTLSELNRGTNGRNYS